MPAKHGSKNMELWISIQQFISRRIYTYGIIQLLFISIPWFIVSINFLWFGQTTPNDTIYTKLRHFASA